MLWTDPSGSHVIGLLFLRLTDKKGANLLGVGGGGRFTPLPALIVPSGAVDNAGGIAF